MGDQDASAARSERVRIAGMSISPPYPPGTSSGPGAAPTIVVQLDPGPDRAEAQWWTEQLRKRVNVKAWSGSGGPGSAMRLTALHVEADGELEAVARQVVAAVDEANAAYPDRYGAWRQERDAQVAQEQSRERRRVAEQQTVLDRVMDEYRSGQNGST